MQSHHLTEGPLGLPMTDQQARRLEAILKSLPGDPSYRRRSAPHGLMQLKSDARTDVSWITVEAPDHAGDLVLAAGMDYAHFALNPIVTYNHRYDLPPVGRSLWRRLSSLTPRGESAAADEPRGSVLRGIQAKTFYPPRPASWSAADWPPDVAFDLVRAGLLLGKSIGFLPLMIRTPTREELQLPQLQNVRHIIEHWLLLEYSCCFLPLQPQAVVTDVASTSSCGSAHVLSLMDPAQFEKILEDSLQRTLSRYRRVC